MATHWPGPTFSFNTNTDSAVISDGAMKKIEYASASDSDFRPKAKVVSMAMPSTARKICIDQRTSKMPRKAPR